MLQTREQNLSMQVDDIKDESSNGKDTNQTLRECVLQTLESYFENLEGQVVSDVYELVLSEVEAPLLESVLKHTGNNQSKAAAVLGLNRGTLRKKLEKYSLL